MEKRKWGEHFWDERGEEVESLTKVMGCCLKEFNLMNGVRGPDRKQETGGEREEGRREKSSWGKDNPVWRVNGWRDEPLPDLSYSSPKAESKPSIPSGSRWRRSGGHRSRIWIHWAEVKLSRPFNWWLFNKVLALLLRKTQEPNLTGTNYCSSWQVLISEASDFIEAFAWKAGKANYSMTNRLPGCCSPSVG